MPEIKNYRDLRVWQLSKELVKDVYQLTEHFPKQETYGLTQQLRRAAISIPSNIAEGHARVTRKDFIQFLSIALGSLAELETQLELAIDLNYVTQEKTAFLFKKSEQLAKMIHTLIGALKNQTPNPKPQTQFESR